MKKLYVGVSLLFLSAGLYAQNSIEALNAQLNFSTPLHQPSVDMSRSTNCGQDTVLYGWAKATALATLSINNATSATSLGQYFECPQSITVSGFGFYAYKTNTAGGISTNVTASIYLAGADSLPSGAPLASVSVPVDTNFYNGSILSLYKVANFTTPVTVNAPYIVVISNNSPNSVGIISNSYAAGNGAGEWLACAQIGSTWLNSSDVVVGGIAYNADVLFEPFVSYTLTADFTMNNSCFNSDATVNFTNQSSPILNHRMYNQAAFMGAANFSYYWNYGDGSPVQSVVSPSHAFTGTGPWSITLTDTIFGWTITCVDSKTKSSYTSTTADFSYSANGLTVSLTDESTGGPSAWTWSYGDSSPDGNTQNPSHTYASSGTYEVCLNVTGFCESAQICDSVTVCVSPLASYSANVSGADVTFTGSTEAGATYSWNFGDGSATVSSSTATHTFADNGTYEVCYTVSNICGSTDTCTQVVICRAPIADFSSAQTGVATFEFSNESTYGDIYSWNFDGAGTSTDENPSFTFNANGSYNVCLTVTNSCGQDSSEYCEIVSVQGLGISDVAENRFSIFPNPAKGQLNILLIESFGTMQGAVINAVGQTVQNFTVNQGTQSVSLNIESLSAGVYFIKLVEGNSQMVKRFVVSK